MLLLEVRVIVSLKARVLRVLDVAHVLPVRGGGAVARDPDHAEVGAALLNVRALALALAAPRLACKGVWFNCFILIFIVNV